MNNRAAVVVAGLVLACCSRAAAPPAPVVYDLAKRAPVADWRAGWQLVLFGTPAAEPHQEWGFVREAAEPGSDNHAIARRRVQVLLTWPQPIARVAALDVSPYPGLAGPAVKVRLNGKKIGRVVLAEGRRRYRLDLPAEEQEPGDNHLAFFFESGTRVDGESSRQLAARFFSLAVGPSEERSLADLIADGAPPPLSTSEAKGAPSVTQAGPSVLRYALRLPDRAELRFTPDLPPAAGRPVRLRVTLQGGEGDAKEIWSAVLRPGGATFPVVALPLGHSGEIVGLGLHVEDTPDGRAAWAIWRAPRILGVGPADLLTATPLTGAETRRADALRGSLAGSSALLVILDAAGARHFGCYGYPRATTPEIDRLAAEGVVFERAYTPAVFTLSAMASVWTSLHHDQHHEGVAYNAVLPKDRLTLAELLTAQGVHTAGFISNGMAGPAFGLDRGFAEFRVVGTGQQYRARAFVEALPPWIEANKGRTFFAYLHVREPHFPYDPGPPFDTLFGPDRPLPAAARRDQGWQDAVNRGAVQLSQEGVDHLARLYDGNLASADRELGRLRRALEAAGIWDRLVVMIAADHGEQLYEHGFVGHNKQLYEDSVHVPLVVRFPKGKGPAGVRVGALVSLLDLAPTIADVFGVGGKAGSDRAFQGRSLLPVILGAPGAASLISRTVGEQPTYSIRDARFKYIANTRYGTEELYRLDRDPDERDNLAKKEPLIATGYRQALHRWILEQRRREESAGESPRLTPEQIENLRALGYVR